MKEITLFDKQNEIVSKIRHEGDMVNLTDLWREAGADKDKTPNDWANISSSVQLIETVANIYNTATNGIIKSKRGKGGGTWGHKQIALAYAKYLDPKLHVLVNEVFFQRIEEEKNPELIIDRATKTYKKRGMSDEWISMRFKAINGRNAFTSCLAEHGVERDGFKNCTNAIYAPLYGGTTAIIRKNKNLPEKANIRDNMSKFELQCVEFAEALSTNTIESENIYGNSRCEFACTRSSKIVANAVIQSKQKIN
jgi:hypothetical protein